MHFAVYRSYSKKNYHQQWRDFEIECFTTNLITLVVTLGRRLLLIVMVVLLDLLGEMWILGMAHHQSFGFSIELLLDERRIPPIPCKQKYIYVVIVNMQVSMS